MSKEKDTNIQPESQEDENIYLYSEDDNEDLDNSPFNYSQLPDDEDDEDEEDTVTDQIDSEKGEPSPFLLMLKVLSNPIEGWKEVRRSRLSVENAQKNCFYPLLALMSVCYFATLFYSPRSDISQVVISAVTAFVGFFAGYFCIMILLKILLPEKAAKSVDTDFGKVFVILNLSSLCLFFAALELLPMLWALLVFLPLWTVYVICRGTRFFNFPENRKIQCIGILCLLIVGVPSLIEWALNEVLPN